MAFTVTHRAEFTDINGVDWRVDILKDQAQAAIATLQVTGEPLNIEWLTPGDSLILNPIKGSTATLNLECNTNFEYIGFYSSEDMVYKMKIYYGAGNTLYWQGWLTSDYTEPYDAVPYTVSLVAADGLGLLRSLNYDNSGALYNGRDEESDIVLKVLAKIGYTQFTEFCNIYEDRMADATTDSPMNQVLIDQDVFIDSDNIAFDCYTVLESILLKYNAIIRQHLGEFVIFRPIELIGDIVYGRVFPGGAGTHIDPDQFIQRPILSATSDIIDIPGGVLMMQSPLSKFTAEQDYGYKESWIENHRFSPDSFDRITEHFDYWTISGTNVFHPLQFRTSEPEGLLINPHIAGPYILQYFGTYARQSASDTFRFEFDYKFINDTGADVSPGIFGIALMTTVTPYYLTHPTPDDDTTAVWDTPIVALSVTEATVTKGQGQWKTWTRYVTGLPESGSLIIVLYPHASLYLCINNVRFYATSDTTQALKKKKKKWYQGLLKGLFSFTGMVGAATATAARRSVTDVEEIVSNEYSATNAITAPEITQDYILGDCANTGIHNVIEQFKGSLAIATTAGSLNQTAIDFVNSWALDYLAGGVILTSNGADVIFTSDTPGTDFTGATTITNATGTLAGGVVNTTANATGTAQVTTITLTGSSGVAHIVFNGYTKWVIWNTNLTDTATDFVTAEESWFVVFNITLTSAGADLIFTEAVQVGGFSVITIHNNSGNLNGGFTPAKQTAAVAAAARVDTVTLTGSTGTANILCDDTTKLATYSATAGVDYTVSWHTGNHPGNAEAKPLIEIVADEIASLHSKGRHFIQLNMAEAAGDPVNYYPIYNLQDPYNVTGADYKCFATNRANFDVRNREWTVDIIEIGVK